MFEFGFGFGLGLELGLATVEILATAKLEDELSVVIDTKKCILVPPIVQMSKTPLSKEDLRSARLRSLGINEPPNDSASIPSSATGASTSHAAAITTGNSLQSVASPSSSSSVARLDYQDSELSSAMELSKNEFSLLCDLLFRNSGFVTAEDMNRWCNEGFRFCGKPNFGLMQGYGGPCGVLAVVQAEILRDLFFDDNLLPVSSNFDDLPENVDPTQASFALARGLYRILKRVACETNSIRIVSLKEDVSEVVLRHFSTWQESLLTVTSFTTEERFLAAMTSQELPFHRQFESGAGCLLFLMSCILTRGFSLVQTDMASDPTSSCTSLPFTSISYCCILLFIEFLPISYWPVRTLQPRDIELTSGWSSHIISSGRESDVGHNSLSLRNSPSN